MDVSKYSFLCQKALHQGLQYARSFGHKHLEVEHIALAMLRGEAVTVSKAGLKDHLQKELSKLPRVFGNVEIKFGLRLDNALDEAEAKADGELVDEELLWDCLEKQSTMIRTYLAGADETVKTKKPPKPQTKKKSEPKQETGKNNETPSEEDEDREKPELPEKLEKVLAKYTLDLTALAERGELDPVIGRDFETRRVIEILGRKKKNNPILIGEAGVGKTAVAESLALRIIEGRVPEPIKGKRVLTLDLGGLVAGAKFRGEFEDRVKNLLEAIKACDGQVILFIDEIHMIVGAGSAEGSADIANLLKPALARGEIKCLGATTLDEFRNYIEKDPALERRFQPVKVEEPSREMALSVLRGLKGRYEIHHGVRINDEALVKAVDLSIRFLANRQLPDKAIDLLDESCSRLRMQIDSVPSVMDDLRSQIDQLHIERKAIEDDKTAKKAIMQIDVKLKDAEKQYQEVEKLWRNHQVLLEKLRKGESKKQEMISLFENTKAQGNFELAAKLQYSEVPKIESEVEEIRNELDEIQGNHSWLRQEVGGIEVAEVIALWTSIPVNKVMKDESQQLQDMEKRLSKRVFGQPLAVQTVSKAVRRARVGVNDPNRPLGVFLFVGPTGVGKTETVKALAEEVFNDETRLVRIDMSEYMEQHAVSRLVGSPPGYVGYGEGGQLTEPVRRTPYTVVLLDEIEKAHTRVLDILLQLCDDGRLTDGNGRVVNFCNTLVVMTSNIPLDVTHEEGSQQAEDEVRDQLAQSLRPEFVGRIDEVVLFKPLGRVQFENLLNKLLLQLNKRLAEQQFRVVLGEKLQSRILSDASSGNFGGRAVKRVFQSLVIDSVADKLLKADPNSMKGAWLIELDEDGGITWKIDDSLHKYLPPARGA